MSIFDQSEDDNEMRLLTKMSIKVLNPLMTYTVNLVQSSRNRASRMLNIQQPLLVIRSKWMNYLMVMIIKLSVATKLLSPQIPEAVLDERAVHGA